MFSDLNFELWQEMVQKYVAIQNVFTKAIDLKIHLSDNIVHKVHTFST